MELDIDFRKTLHSGKRSFHLDVRLRTDSRRIVFYGPSGAGKSLTLKVIAGLLKPDEGHIRLGGTTFHDHKAGIDLPAQARKLAYLFQDYALFPHLTVRQNIAFGLTRGWRNPRADTHHETVDHWLATFHLEALAHQYPAELSGGQRQRTALARALAPQPHALLLDEPFAALDPALRTHMRAGLDELQRRLDVPMILISHDEDDAAIFGDHLSYLQGGRIVERLEELTA